MRFIIFIILVFCNLVVSSQPKFKQVLKQLDDVIENRDYFTDKKDIKIQELKENHQITSQSGGVDIRYRYYQKLYKEYMTFKFDSALHYSTQLVETAYLLHDDNKLAYAKIQYANILISAGLFNESMEILKNIDLKNVNRKIKADYYKAVGRGYFDMESFSQSSKYAKSYSKKGLAAYDSAMLYLPIDSWEYLALSARVNIKHGKNNNAIEILNELISDYTLNNDQLAIQLMALAFAHNNLNNHDKALNYMAQASIADFKGAKRSAVAPLYLANYLYENGDVIRASKYVNVALENSKVFGSNFRLWQVSQFLPFIKSEHIITIEKQKQKLWNYILIISILALIIAMFLLVIFMQIKRLRKSKKIVDKINHELKVSNEELVLANKIKEEYVGYYFMVSSELIKKLDKYKKAISKKVRIKQYDQLLNELESININREKAILFNNFDQAFLKIFPKFVSRINELLVEEEQISIKEGQLLNNELRIYALMRLGIRDADRIAKILDYSVNTIYAYKSKIKNKAISPDKFEKDVINIKRY